MDSTFQRSVSFVLGAEGADSDNQDTDPDGGLTRFGISQKQHPEVNVPALTRTSAVAWYQTNVWNRYRCGDLPWPVCLVVFDACVNQGNPKALQRALGVSVDGVIGPVTIGAAAKWDPVELAVETLGYRAIAYVASANWPANGRGWMNRLFHVAIIGSLPT